MIVNMVGKKQLIPHIITIVIFLFYNVSTCLYLQYNQKQKDRLILEVVQNQILTLLSTDIATALNSNLHDKNFFLCRNVNCYPNELKLSQGHLFNFVKAINSTIYVQNEKEMLIIEAQCLADIIARVLPNYITFMIKINNNIIINNNVNNLDHITKHNKIGHDATLSVKVAINPASYYYVNNINQLYKYLFLNVITSLIICLVILYIYLRKKQNITLTLEQLEDNLLTTQKMSSALMTCKKSSKNLNSFFIQKATEEYIKQQLQLDSNQNDQLIKIGLSNYLFPLRFTDYSRTKIDTQELLNHLQDYFAPHFLHTAIKYQCKLDKLIVDCGKHVFYQIIFSIICNVLKFMEEQSNIPKLMVIKFTEDKLVITYDGFLLTERIMINLSNGTNPENVDPFLLDCSKIFKSLKVHKLNYKIFNEDGSNIIEITLCKTKKNNKGKAEVINFAKYKQENDPI